MLNLLTVTNIFCQLSTVLFIAKVIPYGQALRFNRVCPENEFFDKRCNELQKYLSTRGYSDKMVRKELELLQKMHF